MTNRRAQITSHFTSHTAGQSQTQSSKRSIFRSAVQVSAATALALALTSIASTAIAAGPGKTDAIKDETTLKAASLAATCANCHNTGGKGVDGAAVPGLSYLKASYIESQMLSFKRGEREATVMHQLSKGYTDEQIKIIADYLGQK